MLADQALSVGWQLAGHVGSFREVLTLQTGLEG